MASVRGAEYFSDRTAAVAKSSLCTNRFSPQVEKPHPQRQPLTPEKSVVHPKTEYCIYKRAPRWHLPAGAKLRRFVRRRYESNSDCTFRHSVAVRKSTGASPTIAERDHPSRTATASARTATAGGKSDTRRLRSGH